ncbi:hypothetical protein PTKIN_Ptkin11bG0174100 [Pterospermum kingtungense]
MLRSKTSTKKVPAVEIAARPPLEIGTRGTVGALVLQEIEYFRRLESGGIDGSKKPHSKRPDQLGSQVSAIGT